MQTNKLLITLLITLLTTSYHVKGQITPTVDKWMEYVEEMAAEAEDEQLIEVLFSELSYLSEHPFDLNKVSAEELRKLPFLSDFQIADLINYRKRNGHFLTLYELKDVDALDMQTLALLVSFVAVDKPPVDNKAIHVNNLLKKGNNELQIRYDQGYQQKKGYQQQPDSVLEKYPNRRYLGEPFYHSLRYSYTFDDRIQLGFVGEKDAGEPFFNTYHKGYDYYSGHLFLKDFGWLKSLAVGDYKVSFGQGLVVSNDFTPGRSSIVTQAERRTNGFRRHYSTNETDFFRGVAATAKIRSLEISLFYSYRKMDATVSNDTFPSLKTDGLHRLQRDWEKRRTVPLQTFGGNFRYVSSSFAIGMTALSYSFGNKTLVPDPKPYSLYHFSGSQNHNVSVDYRIGSRKLKLFGETAFSKNGGWATLNALQLAPTSYFTLFLLHRYYDKRYQAFFGNAFSQSSSVQNEQGFYSGIQFVPLRYWKLSAYADIFRFPWLKYGIDAPSTGREYQLQADYTRSRSFSGYIRYKYRQKEKNKLLDGNKIVSIMPYAQHRLRTQLIYSFHPAIILKSSAETILYKETDKQSRGWMLAQNAGWKPSSLPVQADLYVAWFHTDDYSSRISSYEKNILYAFQMPGFYGKGIRLAATFRWDITKKLALSAKLAHTYYSDRDEIGTDLEVINGCRKTDLFALLRWKF